jgi:serine/alanine adding enzyme
VPDSKISVKELDGDDAVWRDYVRRSPLASSCHVPEWRDVITKSFGHRARYLMALDGAAVCGVLPLIEMDSSLFGHFFVSLPFLNYGGILADTPQAELALAEAVVRLARDRRASHVELRQIRPSIAPMPGWTLSQHKAALVLKLAGDPKRHWDGLNSRLRGKVRKAEKNGFEFSIGGGEFLTNFYHLYALNMRDLGTPVYSRSFFENVAKTFAGTLRILQVSRAGKPAAALIALRDGNRVETPWICQDYGQSSFNVNEFLYWKTIELACIEDVTELDLGRSSIDAGTYRFKMQWNPEPRPLHWYYWTPPGVATPRLNPDNPKYAMAVNIWKKLPLGVANLIGPHIVRNIP